MELDELNGEDLAALVGSSSLERLYVLLREAHAEIELRAFDVANRRADLEAARRELDKAMHMQTRTEGRSSDIEKAIIDRRRAERGITLTSGPVPPTGG